MHDAFTADEKTRLEIKLRLETARFGLQRSQLRSAAARGAVERAKGEALQAHCRTLLCRADFFARLDQVLSRREPKDADGLLTVVQLAAIAEPTVRSLAPSDDSGVGDARPLAADGADESAPPLTDSDQEVLRSREKVERLDATCAVAQAECLRAWLELLACAAPCEAWEAAGKLRGSDRYGDRAIRSAFDLLARFNDWVRL